MNISTYLNKVKEQTKARELNLELTLNDNCEVDREGKQKLKIKLTKKD